MQVADEAYLQRIANAIFDLVSGAPKRLHDMALKGRSKVIKENNVTAYTERHTSLLEEAVAARPRGGGVYASGQESIRVDAGGAMV